VSIDVAFTLRKRALPVVLAALFAAGALGGTVARADDESSKDNAAVAVVKQDGQYRFRMSMQIGYFSGDTLDNQNVAYAYASCSSCRADAIAVQVVLVRSTPSTVAPKNLAYAINDQCSSCQTLGSAYQFVVSAQDARLSDQGREQIDRIREQLESLRDDGLSVADEQARIDDLMAQLKQVLDTQIVPKGAVTEHHQDEDEP
jgi:putative peptide zinc metalloprotease protein